MIALHPQSCGCYDCTPGFPATATRVRPDATGRRSLPIKLSGQPQPGKAAHNAKPPAAEYGWLTPLRKSKGDSKLWFFRCRCGNEMLRAVGEVRRMTREGKVCKCKDCAIKAKVAGAKSVARGVAP